MPSGRLLSSKRREAKEIAKAISEGIAAADRKKPVEESAKEHLGKAIDRVDPLDLALYSGLAYVGYEVFKDWKGALFGPIALKLATSPNEIASAAGLAGLVSLGLAAALPNVIGDWQKTRQEAIIEQKKLQDAPEWQRPHCLEWVLASISGSTYKSYCEWHKDFYPSDPAPFICGGPLPKTGVPPEFFNNETDCKAYGYFWYAIGVGTPACHKLAKPTTWV